MRIGVIDVGSNTTRLLVADAASDDFVPLIDDIKNFSHGWKLR